MERISFEFLLILLLLLANGFFAMAEIAVVSVRKARLQQPADEGDKRAQAALKLAQDPDEFLSTVQIGITLIGTLAGAFGGAALSGPLGALIARVPALAPYAQGIAFALVVMIITYLSLVIGELAPKRLGLNNPERIAMAVAGPMRVLSHGFTPLVRLLTASTDLLLRIFNIRPSGEPAVTEEEIKVMITQGAEAGILSAAESEVVQGVFRLADRRVGSLMTPRTEIAWLEIESTPEELVCAVAANSHSCYPVCRGGLDNVLGVVEAQDLLVCRPFGGRIDLRGGLLPPLFVPETLPAVRLLEMYHGANQHLALIVDEYGGIQGLVTMHDILHAAVGDILHGDAEESPRAVQREDGSWLLDGRLSAEDFRSVFGLENLPGEEAGTFETLGGFVMMHLSRIPMTADHFDWGGLRFEVLDMDGRRVDKVLVSPAALEAREGEQHEDPDESLAVGPRGV